jgi:hypothetical protein
MSLTTVAELRTALGVGTLYADATLQEVCNAADNVLLPFLWNNDTFNVAHSADDFKRTLYFDEIIRYRFYVGQSIVVSDNDEIFDGTYTVTEVGEYSISYLSEDGGRERPYHEVNPYGKVAAQDDKDYSLVPAVQEAALMISIDIWQSRQAPSSGGVSIDGYTPSPYRMGNTLMARVRGLLAPYLDPNSMVG